jgi:glycerol-3-phosphate dehydrogenase
MPGLSTQLLVIGGGATGLGVALDATLRGIKTVLVEKSDLGQGTSGRYHGLLHSGGRYVISDPVSATDCAQENRILRRLAPSCIEDTGGLFVSVPTDPQDFPDRWIAACRTTGVAAREVPPAGLLRREPLLNPRITRAFEVQDASLDSFDLLHLLSNAIQAHGGQVWPRCRVEHLVLERGRIGGAVVRNLVGDDLIQIGADLTINAAGPWAGAIAAMAGIDIPIALGKGAMLAMASRLVNTVVNRCKPPADGDIFVPVGTVSVLGTTDVRVTEADSPAIEPWEIDLLLAEGELLVPSLPSHRPLRAWAGVRPLYRPRAQAGDDTRGLPRAHTILDHEAQDGLPGMISVFGGKLTTYRLMAEQVVDLAARHLSVASPCTTATTPLEPPGPYHTLRRRHGRLEDPSHHRFSPGVLCECELITRDDLEQALTHAASDDLDDIRRDLRLGMGPCQAAFCGYRAAGMACAQRPSGPADGGLAAFLDERWRGIRPVGWGQMLRQLEMTRRFREELLALPPTADEGDA